MQNLNLQIFFKLYISAGFIDELVTQTNKYVETLVNNEGMKENSRMKEWHPISFDEMKVFLSLIIAMGLVQKSERQQYWSNFEVVDTTLFRNYMSRDRFIAILSNLHLADKEKQVPRGEVRFDPLFKIRPFISLIIDSFPEI